MKNLLLLILVFSFLSGTSISISQCRIKNLNIAIDDTCVAHPFTFKSSVEGYKNLEYLWDFGDGSTSTVANTTHQFKATGAYLVKLTVHNEKCSDTIKQALVVRSCGCGDQKIEVTNKINCQNVQFFADVLGFKDPVYQWNFGDNTKTITLKGDIGPAPSHHYEKPGEYTIVLRVIGKGKYCPYSFSKKVIVPKCTK